MQFSDDLKLKVKPDGKVRISIRLSDSTVIVKEVTMTDVERMIADFKAQQKSYHSR